MSKKEHNQERELFEARSDPTEWETEAVPVDVRPTGTEVISFRVSSELLDRIEDLANASGTSMSEFVRSAVIQRVERSSVDTLISALDFSAKGPAVASISETRLVAIAMNSFPTASQQLVPDEPPAQVSML